MTKRTFPNPLLAALFLMAMLTATAFATVHTISWYLNIDATETSGPASATNPDAAVDECDTDDGPTFSPSGPPTATGWTGTWDPTSATCENGITFAARWVKANVPDPTEWTITLTRGGPDGHAFTAPPASVQTVNKKLAAMPDTPSPQPECYQFSHWENSTENPAVEVTEAYLRGKTFDKNSTFTAKWNRTCYTVKLDLNGPAGHKFDTPDPASVNTNAAGKLTSIPAAPTLPPTCRTFSHWTVGSTTTEVTQAYLSSLTVTESNESSTSFKANWTPTCVAVTINPGEGSGFLTANTPTTIATNGTGNSLTPANITEIKARLKAPECHSASPDDIKLYKVVSGGPNVEVKSSAEATPTTFIDDDEVIAEWKRTCYVATIDEGAGKSTIKTILTDKDGKLTTTQLDEIKSKLSMDANYCFNTDKTTLKLATDVSGSTPITTDTELDNPDKAQNKIFAVWTRTCYIVKIEKNAGTASKDTVWADVNGKFATADRIAEVKALFTAGPVCTSPLSTDPVKLLNTNGAYDDTEINTNTAFANADTALNKVYAVFKDAPGCRKITFNSDGGSLATVAYEIDATTGKIKSPGVWPNPNPTKAQNSFAGWKARDKEGDFFTVTSDTDLGASGTFAGVSNIIAVAQWIPNSTPARPAAPAIASTFSIVVNSQSLQIVGASKAMPVSIYNLKGKLVLNSTAAPNESISLAHLPKGVYIVRAGSKTAKFAR